MREILFRGKCKDTGKWNEGYYIHLHKTTYCFKEDYDRNPDNDMHQIIFEEMMDWGLPNQHFRVDVLPETVGQYTGLLDKDGKKVFEGDIVKVYDNFDCVGETLYVGTVQWDDTFLNWELKTSEKIVWQLKNLPSVLYYEVIGNVFDNPELLEVK